MDQVVEKDPSVQQRTRSPTLRCLTSGPTLLTLKCGVSTPVARYETFEPYDMIQEVSEHGKMLLGKHLQLHNSHIRVHDPPDLQFPLTSRRPLIKVSYFVYTHKLTQSKDALTLKFSPTARVSISTKSPFKSKGSCCLQASVCKMPGLPISNFLG